MRAYETPLSDSAKFARARDGYPVQPFATGLACERGASLFAFTGECQVQSVGVHRARTFTHTYTCARTFAYTHMNVHCYTYACATY